MNTREFVLEKDGVRTQGLCFGSGPKTMIMISGLSLRPVKGSARPLAHTYRRFAKDYTVYLFDRREDLPDGFTVREMAEDLAQNMLQMGLSNADVFGVSQGGMLGQYLAIDHPELVRKLVLAVTASRTNDMLNEAVGNWIRLIENEDYEGMIQDMLVKMYSETYIKKYGRFFPLVMKLITLVPKERFIAMAKACQTVDAYEELDKIKCPVLVLGGQQDKVVSPEASLEIASRLSCGLYMYEQFGHSAYEEAKDFNQRVLEFFQK